MFIKSATILAFIPAIVAAAQNCADNADFKFNTDIGKVQGCAWLTTNTDNEADRISKYCKRGHVREACRSTCESCDEHCADDLAFEFTIDIGKPQKCRWLRLKNSAARKHN